MDPDLNRLVGGDPSWRVIHRQGSASFLFTLVLLSFLVGLLTLMGLGMGIGVVAMAISGIAKAGGLIPALKVLWKSMGCGIFFMAILFYIFIKALRFAWSYGGRLWKDRRAEPELLRGEVQALEEEPGYRGSSMYFLTVEGCRMSVGAKVFNALKIGQQVVAEVKPFGPTLMLLLARDRD